MEKLKQFIEKLEWIMLGLIVDFIFLFFDILHGKKDKDSLFTILLNGDYLLIFKDISYIISILVITVITFYIVKAIPKLFRYEEDYDVKDGLGYFFKYKRRCYGSELSVYASILFFIILIISFLYMRYKYGI